VKAYTTQVERQSRSRNLLIILTTFVAVHGALWVHGLIFEESFLAGDRSHSRLGKITYVFQGEAKQSVAEYEAALAPRGFEPGWLGRAFESGRPGDYIIQGLILAVGNRHLLVAFHLALSLVSVICTYYLTIFLGVPDRLALVAAILYSMLPGSLVHPHQLASEALSNPLVAIGFFIIIGSAKSRLPDRWLLVGVASLALSMFVRPQQILYSFLLALILGASDSSRWRSQVLAIVPICFLLPLAWGLFVFSQTGEYTFRGRENYDLNEISYLTAEGMNVIADVPFDASEYPDKSMPVPDFLRFALGHPVGLIHLELSNSFNLILNSGAYSVASHHLGFFPNDLGTMYWKGVRVREGVIGLVMRVLQLRPGLVAIVIGGTVAWGVILIVTVIGGIAFSRDGRSTPLSKAVLFSYLFYALLIALVLTGARWGQRTPLEFLIAILFAVGMEQLTRRIDAMRRAISSEYRNAQLTSRAVGAAPQVIERGESHFDDSVCR
jgi:hypothetical protein